MHFGSAVELYLTMLAWHLYNGIWEFLAESGLAILPFIAIIIKALISTAEKKNKMQDGSIILQSLETPVYMMLFVMMVAFVPTINLHLENMTETRLECSSGDNTSIYGPSSELKRRASSNAALSTNTTYDDPNASLIVTLQGDIPKAPVWWYFFHKLSQASALALTNILPCNPDLRSLRADVNYLNINDQLLRNETSQFLRDCWRPAANQFFRDQPTSTLANIDDDIAWAGSKFFLTTPGYYDKSYAQENLSSFPFNYGPDAKMPNGDNEGAIAENRGQPYCHHWWQNTEFGLRGRLLTDINIYFNDRSNASSYIDAIKAWFNGDNTEMEDALLRSALNAETRLSGQQTSNSFTRENQGAGYSAGDRFSQVFSTIGIGLKTLGSTTEAHIYRQAAPIVQSLVIMLFICILPILQLLSLYSIETLVTLTVTLFSIIFWTFLFALAYWLDNFLLGALESAGADGSTMLSLRSISNPSNHSQELDIINWITRFMYIFLPLLFTSFMGLVTKGAVGSIGEMTGRMGKGSANAGGQGGATVQKIGSGGRF